MKKNTLRATFLAAVAAPVLLITAVGTANAYSSPTFEGGRGRIQVTVVADPALLAECVAIVPGLPWRLFKADAGKTASTLFSGLAVGTYRVQAVCRDDGGGETTFTSNVAVTAPDRVLDAVDVILAGAGSSALTTDPTLR